MKNRILALLTTSGLLGCTTAQLNQAEAVIDPIAVSALTAYAAAHGIPPTVTAPVATAVFGQIWGGIAALQTKQPLATGVTTPAVAQALTSALPAGASTSTKIALLTAAASSLPVP